MALNINELLSKFRFIKPETGNNVLLGYDKLEENLKALSINSDGSLAISEQEFNIFREIGIYNDVNPNDTVTIFTKRYIESVEVVEIILIGNGNGIFDVKIDDKIIYELANSYFNPSIICNTNFKIDAGQRLSIEAKNNTIKEEFNSYKCFIFLKKR